jgi:hypothetical protein
LRCGAELSDKIVELEVIKKNTCSQYEGGLVAQSDIYRVDQERFKSRITAMTLAEMTWLYSSE